MIIALSAIMISQQKIKTELKTAAQLYSEWSKRINPNKLNYLCNFADNHDNARVLSWGGNW